MYISLIRFLKKLLINQWFAKNSESIGVNEMINEIYSQLKTPKNIEEIHMRFSEIGLDWNEHQIKLFLGLDKNIKCESEMWSFGEGDLSTRVVSFLEELFKNKPAMPINLILKDIPFTIGKPEFLKIVELSQHFYIHPNGNVICKK